MKKIRLELDFLEIQRKRRIWNIYFILATEHPEDETKTVLSVFPSEPIPVRPLDNNRIDFEPKGTGNDLNGMFVLEREMPEDDSVRVRLWAVQSRERTRNIGDVLKEVSSAVSGSKVTDAVLKALGATTPWIAIGNSILKMSGIVGNILKESKDTKKGFINMDESFTTEEIDLGEIDRDNRMAGFGEVGWSWTFTKGN